MCTCASNLKSLFRALAESTSAGASRPGHESTSAAASSPGHESTNMSATASSASSPRGLSTNATENVERSQGAYCDSQHTLSSPRDNGDSGALILRRLRSGPRLLSVPHGSRVRSPALRDCFEPYENVLLPMATTAIIDVPLTSLRRLVRLLPRPGQF